MKERLHRALRWSEKYTKTDMVYLTKGGFWLTLAKGLSIITSLISSVAFANLLPAETYGVFRYVLSVIMLLAIPTLDGIDSALTRSLAKGENVSHNALLYTKMKWGVLGSVASLLIASYYLWQGNVVLGLSFLVTAAFIPLMDPFHLYAAIHNGEKNFNVLAKEEVVTRASVALILIGIVFVSKNPIFIIFSFLFCTTLFRFWFLVVCIKKRKIVVSSKKNLNSIISYGKHLTVISMLGKLATQIDKILLFQTFGGAVLAGFYLALMPFKQAQNFFNTVSMLALPKFSNTSPETLKKTLPLKILKLYIILIPAVLLYIIFANQFFSLVFPLYTEYVLASQLLMLQLLFFPRIILHNAILSQNQKNKLYTTSTIHAVLRIGLIVVLIPFFGIYGAVGAILIATLVNTVLLVISFLRI